MAKFNILPAAQRLIQEGGQATPEFFRFLANLFNAAVATTASVASGGTGNASLGAHGVLIGEGTNPVAVTAAGGSGALLVGQGAADPAFKSMSGDATLAANGALTIAANAVTNAKLAQAPAFTIKGNNTGNTASDADLTAAQAAGFLLLRSYLAGLTLSNDGASPNTVLDIAAGVAADSTNAVLINLGAFTKSTGGSWVAGSGGNGMGTGLTVANNTWYHVFAIVNAGAADVYFDTSVSAANAPAGTTAFRRVGSFRTDGSAHILAFSQNGDEFLWGATPTDINGAAVPASAASITLTVPPGVKVNALVSTEVIESSGAIGILFFSPGISSPVGYTARSNTTYNNVGMANVRTNTSQQINVLPVEAGAGTYNVWTLGWIDTRGRVN